MINDSFNEMINEVNKLYEDVKIWKDNKNVVNINEAEKMMVGEIKNEISVNERSNSLFSILKNG